jgi:hypothetical protein
MKEKTKNRQLNEDELSDVQIKNIDLLNKHYDEIMSDINQVLNKYDIDLSLSSFILSPNSTAKDAEKLAESGACCCASGHYVSNCSLCSVL